MHKHNKQICPRTNVDTDCRFKCLWWIRAKNLLDFMQTKNLKILVIIRVDRSGWIGLYGRTDTDKNITSSATDILKLHLE